MYIAEKKQPKSGSYFGKKSGKSEDDSKKDETVKVSKPGPEVFFMLSSTDECDI